MNKKVKVTPVGDNCFISISQPDNAVTVRSGDTVEVFYTLEVIKLVKSGVLKFVKD